MDFEDERTIPASQEENQSASTSTVFLSSSQSLSSTSSFHRRGNLRRKTAGRIRRPARHLPSHHHQDDDNDDHHDNDHIENWTMEESLSLSSAATTAACAASADVAVVRIRGAGASPWAIQDAGSVQMINDECSYLCSTLVSARTAIQAFEIALELAHLLSSKKSRSILWQTCTDPHSGIIIPSPTRASPGNTTTTNGGSHQGAKEKKSRTILDAILDAIACISNGTSASKSPRNRHSSGNSSLGSLSAATGSPTRNTRTKSARRKLKQQNQCPGLQDSDLSVNGTSSWWSQSNSGGYPEISQILSIMVYFISLDCTLSKDHSVAAMGGTTKPPLARSIRSIFINHSKALKGILQLCIQREKKSRLPHSTNSEASFHQIPSSVASSVSLGSTTTLSASIQSSLSDDGDASQRKKQRLLVQSKTYGISSSLSSPEDSLMSSMSFGNENMADVGKLKSIGDPTKAGRLKRRHRMHRTNTGEDDVLNQKLPAVPEGEDLDDFDWESDRIVPPPKKRTKHPGNSNGVVEPLSTHESSFLSNPCSPPRKSIMAFRPPSSPGDRSVASSVVSLESSNSLLNARTAQKLHQLKSLIHFSSSLLGQATTPSLTEECTTSSTPMDSVDPWVSLLCLESLNRVICGKEGDGTSCLHEEEANDEETNPDEDETNPLLQTNRLIGSSGIIPLLSKCMAQGLAEGLDESGVYIDQYWKVWSERMTVVSSLIDNACLFNKPNRRSFAEPFDPFSFDEDPIHNKDGESLIFHILQYLQHTLSLETMNGRSSEKATAHSGVRLLVVRTLTSLTHENDLAAEQMTALHKLGNDKEGSVVDIDHDGRKTTRGVNILTQLVFELESRSSTKISTDTRRKQRHEIEQESRRYDSTICCLNTLSNIIEGPEVRQLLTETHVVTGGGERVLWIRWLCQWLVEQTSGFQDAILSIGKNRSPRQNERVLQQNEDEKLVAAGNGCVLLACLMTGPEVGNPDEGSSDTIRQLILDEMPNNDSGKSTGVALIINTLKAFCNFYHFSLGELSVAVVGPVKKLIDQLDKVN